MINFDQALTFVLENEGGLANNTKDRGGLTNFGISTALLKLLKGKGYPASANDVTLPIARDIYHKEFWLQAPFLSVWHQRIANYIFDCCVHHGMGTGIEIAQRATWAVLGYRFITDDGIMGSKTLAAIKSAGYHMIYALPAERAGYCRLLVKQDPKQKEFINGWLKRCYRI